ncbi:MAG: sigma-54 dependent transcriptional regulator [Nitrospirae bacterium]|nr:sigma-54 dependent transcriptional regulator [Nitrospirota bacterium]MCL5238417.1 sigma-54 dependent transcriptional regulator [Nitrospirota bacterium]
MAKILLIDDEKNILKVISALLLEEGHEVVAFLNAEDALKFLAAEGEGVDVIISDQRLPGIGGLEFLRRIREKEMKTPFMIITAYGSIDDAVSAIKLGADHYLSKPINDRELLEKIDYLLKKKRSGTLPKNTLFCGIIGESRAIKGIFQTLQMVASSRANVLVTGESGTGKELIARALHRLSCRMDHPFVAVNCSAIPEALFENELFGHEKGSFTGAYQRETGKIEQAKEGTVFLDELGDISLPLQAKLLRVLQEREFVRLGGAEVIKAACRFVFATNRNLEEMVKAGRFREDLFYRINVIPVEVPPLRERREDIPLLAQYFSCKYAEKNNKEILDIEPEAMDVLKQYPWPGNVRELENTMERAVVLCLGARITADNLPKRLFVHKASIVNPSGKGVLVDFEKKMILDALQLNRWNQTKTAVFLGISRKQLRTRMKNHGILLNDPL